MNWPNLVSFGRAACGGLVGLCCVAPVLAAAEPGVSAGPQTPPTTAAAPAKTEPPVVTGPVGPGKLVRVTFPGMPTAWADAQAKRDVPPMMSIYLPTNYDAARKHPLLIFLNGGYGGVTTNPAVARALSEEKDFVCVSLPLYKAEGTGGLIVQGADGKLAWSAYKVMLAKLEELVPNIDMAHCMIGGFSNGAHMTAALIDQSDGEIARRFSAFFFIEGGGKLVHYDLLKDKSFLMVYGSEQSHPRAKEIHEAALAAGAKATLYGMNNVGHAFPEPEYPAVRKWLRERLGTTAATDQPAAVPAAEPTSRPAAGTVIALKFPEMPKTFAGATPQMAVFLPTNYDPAKKHPLLIFLRGGEGGDDNNPAMARAITEDKDFVCVSLPLFKEKGAGQTALIGDNDCQVAWPLYKTMLAKLAEVVPNIDPTHRVLGGFSNGAHMTAGLINLDAGEAASWFSAFFLIDGGGGVKRFDVLKGKPLLMVCGRWRPKPEEPLAAGVKLTIYWMKNSGHAFPPSEYPVVRQWVRAAAGLPAAEGDLTFEQAVLTAGGKLQNLSAVTNAPPSEPAGVPAVEPANVSASPPTTEPVAAQGREEIIKVQIGGQARTCLVHLPPAWDGKRMLPAVVALPGSGDDGSLMAKVSGFSALADKEGFIVAYARKVNGMSGWKSLYGKPVPGGRAAQAGEVDDVGFIRAVIDQLRDAYHADPQRIYAFGHSSGGYMAYRVAIDLSDRVAAAGIVNGLMGCTVLDGKPTIDEIPSPSSPISLIHVRGAQDSIVKAEGGQNDRVMVKSADDCLQHFIKADKCDPKGRETIDAQYNVVRTLYTGGAAGTEVEMVVWKKGGHNWPGEKEGYSTAAELWDFFRRHPKAAAKASPAVPPTTETREPAESVKPVEAKPAETKPIVAAQSFTGTVESTKSQKRPRLVVGETHYELKAAEGADAGVQETLDKISKGEAVGQYLVKGTVTTTYGRPAIAVSSVTAAE
jgi:polyhydroxybutyrate depolymerase